MPKDIPRGQFFDALHRRLDSPSSTQRILSHATPTKGVVGFHSTPHAPRTAPGKSYNTQSPRVNSHSLVEAMNLQPIPINPDIGEEPERSETPLDVTLAVEEPREETRPANEVMIFTPGRPIKKRR